MAAPLASLTVRHYLILFGVFLAAEILVRPTGAFPLNDDWAYTKSVQILMVDGRIDIGDWPAMTLCTHLLWGYIFTLAGFSFFALRLSTMVSALIGLVFLYRLVTNISGNRRVALVACLTLMLSPLYFNLANTFMTDVNFSTLLIIACYVAERFFSSPSWKHVFIMAFVSVLLVLLRQFGMIVPFCFAFACIFLKRRRWTYVLAAAGVAVFSFAVLALYENYLRHTLSPNASFQFMGKRDFTDPAFRTVVAYFFKERIGVTMLQGLVYCAPFSAAFIVPAARKAGLKHTLTAAAVAAIITFWTAYDRKLLVGNVFQDMSVGADTFYEVLNATFFPFRHTHSWTFNVLIIGICRYALTFISVLAFALAATLVATGRRWASLTQPLTMFVASLILTYVAALMPIDSYFDRYTIPLYLFFMIALSFAARSIAPGFAVSAVLLACFAYVSVAGTHDYFRLNETRWNAYDHVHHGLGVPAGKINAGFEVNCWNDGKRTWWQDFLTLDGFDYLIQYQGEPQFTKYRRYDFVRWFPPRHDSIFIYRRVSQDSLR